MSSQQSGNKCGTMKIRITILCAKNLSKKDFFRLPDPFARINVEGSGQCHSTEVCRATLDPKWNQHYDLHISKGDGIIISVWNKRKIHKKLGGFLGCVRLGSSTIHRLKDTGYQRLDLTKGNHVDSDPVKGQIIVSLMSRDGRGTSSLNNTTEDNIGNITSPDDLPEGWEERSTTTGRVYYVNHVHRTTHWARPTQPAQEQPVDLSMASPSRISDALPGGNIVLSNPSTTSHNERTPNRSRDSREHRRSRVAQEGDAEEGTSSENREARRESNSARRRSARHRHYLSRNVLHQPLDLPEGYEMRTTHQGQVYYYNMRSGTSTWHDPRVPRDLGQINPDDLGPLPSGWELRFTDSRRPYFLNHLSRTTQFTDPRLSNRNVLNNILRTRGDVTETSPIDDMNTTEPPPACPLPADTSQVSSADLNGHSTSPETTNGQTSNGSRVPSPIINDQPVETTETTPAEVPVATVAPSIHTLQQLGPTLSELNNISVSLDARASQNTSDSIVLQNNSANIHVPEVAPTTTTSLTPSAPPAVKTISNIIDMDECLPKYRRDLVAKLKVLRAELQCLQPQSGHCRLDVPRNEIFEESFRQIMKLRAKDLRKRLMVKFRGEEGLDYGGVAREWLYLLSHEMLNPYYGLFQYSRDDIYTLQINPDSAINPDHLHYFYFVGRVIGMAVFHGHYIDGGFTMPFYKMLLNKPIILDDIEAVDPDLHRSLNWMLENDTSNVIDTTFSVEHDSFGMIKMTELKPGGSKMQVTEDNKREYVRLYVNLRFMQGIEHQFKALQKGFTEVVPQHLLRPIDERELELIIGGLGKIDVDDWKQNTRLKHCSTETPVVSWFWQIVDGYSEEMRARLLQFVTGSSRVPLQGFKALQGSTGAAGPRLFTIHQIDAPVENLPKAHTCFNRIDLPPYPSFEKMQEKLTQAVEETCGFAVE